MCQEGAAGLRVSIVALRGSQPGALENQQEAAEEVEPALEERQQGGEQRS